MQTAQRALLVYMRHLSEADTRRASWRNTGIRTSLYIRNWCAGWFIGLEFTLWDWVLRRRSGAEPASEFERANIPDTEVLSWLAEQAGGWWHWDEESREPKFVPPNEWMEIYRNRPATDYS